MCVTRTRVPFFYEYNKKIKMTIQYYDLFAFFSFENICIDRARAHQLNYVFFSSQYELRHAISHFPTSFIK